MPAALATSAPEARVKPALAKAGLDEKFAAIITAEDVHRGRPDPEGYLYAAQQMGRPPSRTVIVGNSNQVSLAAQVRSKGVWSMGCCCRKSPCRRGVRVECLVCLYISLII